MRKKGKKSPACLQAVGTLFSVPGKALTPLNRCLPLSQPCNPAVGGPAKSQLVHEVDALGGEMGKMADRCYLQVTGWQCGTSVNDWGGDGQDGGALRPYFR